MKHIPHLSADLIDELDKSFPVLEAWDIVHCLRTGQEMELLDRAAQRALIEGLKLKLENPKGD